MSNLILKYLTKTTTKTKLFKKPIIINNFYEFNSKI